MWLLPAPARTRRPPLETLKRFFDDECDLAPLPMKRTGIPGIPCKKELARDGTFLIGAAAGAKLVRAKGGTSLRARAINCISAIPVGDVEDGFLINLRVDATAIKTRECNKRMFIRTYRELYSEKRKGRLISEG